MHGGRLSVSPFVTTLGWGVKDRSGGWLAACVRQHDAMRLFKTDPTAFQLISGCNPWACLDGSLETFVVVTENEAALPARPQEEY